MFNRKNEVGQIKEWMLRKSPKTHEDKYYNKCLSSIRVVVENSINCVKYRNVPIFIPPLRILSDSNLIK
jgi:hypothetical protein